MGLQTNPGRRPKLSRAAALAADDDFLDPPPGQQPRVGDGLDGELRTVVERSSRRVLDAAGESLPSVEEPAPTEPLDDPTDGQPHPLQLTLREVESSIDTEMVALLERLDSLREAEEDLLAKLEQLYLELGTLQDSLTENGRSLRESLDRRSASTRKRYDLVATAIQRTLLNEATELADRERGWQERLDEAETRLKAFRERPELAEQIAEFRKLDERMDTLDLLPESYREVVRRHHTDLKEKLRPHLEQPRHEPMPLLRLAVAVAVQGRTPGEDDSRGARLLAVLPVEFPTFERAREGKGDLRARFAFRVLASLSRFIVHIGARAEPRATDLGGVLGIELVVDDLDMPLSAVDLSRALRESFLDNQDPQLARVNVHTDMVFVHVAGIERLWARARGEAEPADEPMPIRPRSPRRPGR